MQLWPMYASTATVLYSSIVPGSVKGTYSTRVLERVEARAVAYCTSAVGHAAAARKRLWSATLPVQVGAGCSAAVEWACSRPRWIAAIPLIWKGALRHT